MRLIYKLLPILIILIILRVKCWFNKFLNVVFRSLLIKSSHLPLISSFLILCILIRSLRLLIRTFFKIGLFHALFFFLLRRILIRFDIITRSSSSMWVFSTARPRFKLFFIIVLLQALRGPYRWFRYPFIPRVVLSLNVILFILLRGRTIPTVISLFLNIISIILLVLILVVVLVIWHLPKFKIKCHWWNRCYLILYVFFIVKLYWPYPL